MTRQLAIVPAYNEPGPSAPRSPSCTCTPRTSTCWWSTTARRTTPPPARAAPARPCCSSRSTSGSAARCSPATSTRSARLPRRRPGRRRRPARPALPPRAARAPALGPELNMVTGSRFLDVDDRTATARRRRGASASAIFPRVLSRRRRPPRHRPDVGPADGPTAAGSSSSPATTRTTTPRSRRRPQLHSHRWWATRCRCGCARASTGGRRSARRSAYYMIKVLLAVFVGLLRARPAIEPGDAAPVHAEHVELMDTAHPAGRDRRRRRPVLHRLRARAPQAAAGALRAAVAGLDGRAARPRRSGRTCSSPSRPRSASTTRRRRCS